MDDVSVNNLHNICQGLVLERLMKQAYPRITIDFDGSVIGTGRYAEGTAIGFNKKKKGQRSYYPLFCAVAQTGQVLAVLHRSGNVYDSNGAEAFILQCIEEIRMDGAFFSDRIIDSLEQAKVEYTISVPFERFAKLKTLIEQRQHWQSAHGQCHYFERHWKPDAWEMPRRFVFIRQQEKIQHKEPVQLDLFTPYEYGYTFKVIITNKTLSAGKLMAYHNGRGSQETRWHMYPHELGGVIRFIGYRRCWPIILPVSYTWYPMEPTRQTQQKRPACWDFMQLNTLRQHIIQRAGRLIRPQGQVNWFCP
jgi:hypothetical protein